MKSKTVTAEQLKGMKLRIENAGYLPSYSTVITDIATGEQIGNINLIALIIRADAKPITAKIRLASLDSGHVSDDEVITSIEQLLLDVLA